MSVHVRPIINMTVLLLLLFLLLLFLLRQLSSNAIPSRQAIKQVSILYSFIFSFIFNNNKPVRLLHLPTSLPHLIEGR